MKRNLLLLAVMVLVVFGFSNLAVAQCNPNDYGECDTLHLAVWDLDNELYEPGPFFVKVNMRITHDIVDEVRDSLAGIVIPLCYDVVADFGAVAYCSLTDYWNTTKMHPTSVPKLERSIFRHMPDMVTQTDTNWMMALSFFEEDLEWDTIILDFAGNDSLSGHFWLSMIPVRPKCRMFWEGDRVLIATMTFKLDLTDSCDVYIDTCLWGDNQRVAFANKDATTFIPQLDWKTDKADVPFHFRPFIVPNQPPYFADPENGVEDQSHNTNDHYSTDDYRVKDDDGTIASVTVSPTSLPGVENITVVPAKQDEQVGHIEYDVINHCLAGGTVTVTVMDDGGATATDDFVITLTNGDPTINAGADKTGPYNVTLSSDAMVLDDPDDSDVPGLTWDVTNVSPATPVANITKVGDHVEFVAVCANVDIIYTVTVTVTDVCGGTGTDDFTMTVTNAAPTVICPDDVEEYWAPGDPPLESGDFDANDPEGEALTITVSAATVNQPVIVGSHVEWTPTEDELCTVFDFTIRVEDECRLFDECTFTMHAKEITGRMAAVVVPNKVYERFGFGHWDYYEQDNYIISDDACPPYGGINPGNFFEIPILLEGFGDITGVYIGGFELEVEFDYIDLTFYGAMRGGLLSARWYDEAEGPPIADSILYSWEYFTYRVLPCTDLHKYKILLFGQADMPDGELRKGYSLGDGELEHSFWFVDYTDEGEEIGASLVWLKFRVANNELLRDLKLPIFFEWEHKLSAEPPYYIIQDWDCAENTMSDPTGNILYVSEDPMQYSLVVCGDDVVDTLDFVDGGVHICSPCTSFVCVRGDINHDDIAYTTADAVLFARYFVEGRIVFIVDMDEQICATDVNADGRTLMLADLVYLIRVILQVAPEIPKLGPSSEVVNVMVYDNIITTECASPISAILFEFDGAVVPTLLTDTDMEMVNKGNKVLVWSRDGTTITTAEVLSFIGDAELVSVTAVDYDTRDLQTSITVKVAPTAFALNPAYPNPFNPFTNLSFTLPEALNYSLKIYNVAGQLVRSYEGMGSAGLNVITWDAKDHTGLEVASGVYFYKLTAAGFSATEKMVMMK